MNCRVCGKYQVDIYAYQRHLKIHKWESDKIEEEIDKEKKKSFRCLRCDKKFSTKHNLARHCKSYCRSRSTLDQIKTLLENVEDIEDRLEIFRMLKIPSEYLGNNIQLTNSNNNTLSIDNSKNTIVNNINQENIDYLATNGNMELATTFLENALNLYKENLQNQNLNQKFVENFEDMLLDLFKIVHVSEDHPENHNIYVPNMRKDKNFYIKDDTWKRDGDLDFLRDNALTYYDYLEQIMGFMIDEEEDQDTRERYIEGQKIIRTFFQDSNTKKILEKSLAKKFFSTLYEQKNIIRKTFLKSK